MQCICRDKPVARFIIIMEEIFQFNSKNLFRAGFDTCKFNHYLNLTRNIPGQTVNRIISCYYLKLS